MCLGVTATAAMVGLGTLATGVTLRRGEPAAIWGTLGFFTLMEALQLWGYGVRDACGTPANVAAQPSATSEQERLHRGRGPIRIRGRRRQDP